MSLAKLPPRRIGNEDQEGGNVLGRIEWGQKREIMVIMIRNVRGNRIGLGQRLSEPASVPPILE
jgi:hypothetical protein